MPYIGRSTEAFGVRSRFTFLASADDTSVSGNDVNGLPLSFTDGAYVDVFLNGVRLKHNTDYVTTTANTISGLSALAANDEIEVVVFDVFSLADMVSKANGGKFEGRVDFNGGVGGSGGALTLKNTDTSDDSFPVITLQTGDTDIAQSDVLGRILFQAPDEGTGTDAITSSARIQALSEGDFSSSNNATSIEFRTATSGVVGTAAQGSKLTLQSDANLLLKDMDTADGSSPTITLQTGDTDIAQDDVLGSINFQAPDEGTGTDAILVAAGIAAVSEGDFSSSSNATKLSFKTGSSEAASEKMSLSSAGILTVSDDIVIKSGGTIGGANDTDLLTLGNAALTVAGTIGGTAITASGVLKTDDTTEATSTTDGSLQTDGGLSVVKDIVAGDDIKLLSDSASIFFGADSEIELRHVADDGLILKHVGTGDGKEPSLTFQAGDNDIAQNDLLGSIQFQAPDEGAGTDAVLVAAGIHAISEGDFSASSNATSLEFLTGASETATVSMSIDSVGAISIGKGGVAKNNFSGFQCLTMGGSAATTGSLIDLEDSSGNIDGRVSGENGGLLIGADPSDATSSSEITFQVDSSECATFNSARDFKLAQNTSGFTNIQANGAVTLADDASITLTSGAFTGGANHLLVYESATGSNCRFYFGYNKSAIETNVEIGGIAFHNADQDGATCLINNGTHGNTLKNREGSSTTYVLMKMGSGGTAGI